MSDMLKVVKKVATHPATVAIAGGFTAIAINRALGNPVEKGVDYVEDKAAAAIAWGKEKLSSKKEPQEQ